MKNYSIQKFTAVQGGSQISVNTADIFAVAPNDGINTSGKIFSGAGALLVTQAGYYLPVKEDPSVATELWLSGLNKMSGTA